METLMMAYPGPPVVNAAKHRDQKALDELIADYMPLVFTIVGWALDGHADVDDVVQGTMLNVVRGISGLQEPDAFRSWTVTIAVREVRDRRCQWVGGDGGLDDMRGTADPGADFVDLTILQLGLCGQCRETVEATRWLDEADQDLHTLWWLEAADQITCGELASALELSPEYPAVRAAHEGATEERAGDGALGVDRASLQAAHHRRRHPTQQRPQQHAQHAPALRDRTRHRNRCGSRPSIPHQSQTGGPHHGRTTPTRRSSSPPVTSGVGTRLPHTCLPDGRRPSAWCHTSSAPSME
ncbi:RNA polymerase sigma factor [Streptomyces sp. NPDC002143]